MCDEKLIIVLDTGNEVKKEDNEEVKKTREK